MFQFVFFFACIFFSAFSAIFCIFRHFVRHLSPAARSLSQVPSQCGAHLAHVGALEQEPDWDALAEEPTGGTRQPLLPSSRLHSPAPPLLRHPSLRSPARPRCRHPGRVAVRCPAPRAYPCHPAKVARQTPRPSCGPVFCLEIIGGIPLSMPLHHPRQDLSPAR